MSRLFNELPTRFGNERVKNRYHIIKAIENLIYELEGMITDAENQYFFSHSSGSHLFNLATRHGFDFENQLIYTTSLLREVAPLMIYQPQQTKNVLTKILTAFYGQVYTHTAIEGLEAPYNLKNRSFVFETDTLEEISFPDDAFVDVENATADEFVQYFNSIAKNVRVIKNKLPNNRESTYLIHKEPGFKSITMIGGTANSQFHFGKMHTPEFQELQVTKQKTPFAKIKWVGSNPEFYRLQKDDYITIESEVLNNIYKIIDATYDEIIVRIDDLGEGVYNFIPSHLLFQFSTIYNLAFNKLQASIAVQDQNVLTVTLPAAAPLQVDSEVPYFFNYSENTYKVINFNRDILYINEPIEYNNINATIDSKNIASKITHGVNSIPGQIKLLNYNFPYTEFTRVNTKTNNLKYNKNILQITTSHKHYLSRGIEVEFRNGIEGIYNVYNIIDNYNFEIIREDTFIQTNALNIKSTNQTNLLKITFFNINDIHSINVGDVLNVINGDNVFGLQAVLFKDLRVKQVINNVVYVNSKYPPTNSVIANNITIKHINKIDTSDLEYKVDPQQEYYQNINIRISKSVNSNLNSFVYNKEAIFTPTSIKGTLKENVYITTSTQLPLEVDDESRFPNEGKIVLDYGGHNEEIVDYVSKVTINKNDIVLNVKSGVLLKNNHKSGVNVYTIHTGEAVRVLPFFVNAPDKKREECIRLLNQAVAAGVFLNTVVLYPEYKNQDRSVKIFE